MLRLHQYQLHDPDHSDWVIDEVGIRVENISAIYNLTGLNLEEITRKVDRDIRERRKSPD